MKILPLGLFGLWLLAHGSLLLAAEPGNINPVKIGSRNELFVDDHLVESIQGLTWKLHEPTKAGIALQFDAPWEGNNCHYVSVFKDGSKYRMYYRAVAGKAAPASGVGWRDFVCTAESDDGITWRRPNLGLYEFEGSKQNNIIMMNDEATHNFVAFRDDNSAAPASERYKAVGGGRKGLFGYVSADGINWRRLSDQRLITNGYFDSQNVVFWDSVRQQYDAYVRGYYSKPGSGEGIRGIRVATSKDFRNWSDTERIDMGDAAPEHFYTNAMTPYFRAPHIFLGFPMRLLPQRQAELPREYDLLRGEGVSDSVFLSSRDGRNWERRFPEAWVRPGRGALNWTDRSNAVATGIVPTGEDEISVYLLEHVRLPTARLRRLTLRPDGFVSLNASAKGGEIVTKPFVFEGSQLLVNYSTSAAGSLRVEILDASGQPIPGYALKDSADLFGDTVRQRVNWDNQDWDVGESWPRDTNRIVARLDQNRRQANLGWSVKSLAGRTVRLRFVLKDADLYAFQFQE